MDPVETDVVCMLNPESDGRVRQDATRVTDSIPVGQADWLGLLEQPNLKIQKGDFLRKASDGTEFRVENILSLQGGEVMQLQLKQIKVL